MSNEMGQVSVLSSDIRTAMAQSIDYFGGVALPDVCTAEFSPTHQQVWDELRSAVDSGIDDYIRFALALPRGHAKTQLLKFLVIYIIAETNRRFILIVCNTVTMARTFIHDVLSILGSDNMRTVYGDWKADVDKDSDEYRKFTFNGRKVILKPLGIGSSTRGTNIDNSRPDVILCDDMQGLEESQSEEVARQQLSWFLGTLLLARSPARCTVIYVGNMYPDKELPNTNGTAKVYGCILRNLELNPEWTTWVIAAILQDGQALWPQVWSKMALLSDLRQATSMGNGHIWYAEVMNSPNPQASGFYDESKLAPYRYTDSDTVIGKYIMIDPSLGKKDSDSQEVGLFYVYDDTGPVFREKRTIQKSSPKLVEEVLMWAVEERVPLICAENYGYQGSLLQWFVHYAELLNIDGIQFLGISRAGVSKNSAIVSSFKEVMNGAIHLHPDVRLAYNFQARTFKPHKSKNVDDVLDLVVYSQVIYINYQTEWLLTMELEVFARRTGNSAKQVTQEFRAGLQDFRF